ncbi:uncharacterized protein [Amphiura filiformis]|uniref:uncharacterized protein n=1 Tax=Amphiura filiformis TaxID=82378 RepID=UPI003B20FE38
MYVHFLVCPVQCHANDKVTCDLIRNREDNAGDPFEVDLKCSLDFIAVSGIRSDCQCLEGYIKDGVESVQKLGVMFGTGMCFKAETCGCYDALTNKRYEEGETINKDCDECTCVLVATDLRGDPHFEMHCTPSEECTGTTSASITQKVTPAGQDNSGENTVEPTEVTEKSGKVTPGVTEVGTTVASVTGKVTPGVTEVGTTVASVTGKVTPGVTEVGTTVASVTTEKVTTVVQTTAISECPTFCHVSMPLSCKDQVTPLNEKAPFRTDPRCDPLFEGLNLPGVNVNKNCVCKDGYIRDDDKELQAVLDDNFGTGMCLKITECREGCTVEDGEIIGENESVKQGCDICECVLVAIDKRDIHYELHCVPDKDDIECYPEQTTTTATMEPDVTKVTPAGQGDSKENTVEPTEVTEKADKVTPGVTEASTTVASAPTEKVTTVVQTTAIPGTCFSIEFYLYITYGTIRCLCKGNGNTNSWRYFNS